MPFNISLSSAIKFEKQSLLICIWSDKTIPLSSNAHIYIYEFVSTLAEGDCKNIFNKDDLIKTYSFSYKDLNILHRLINNIKTYKDEIVNKDHVTKREILHNIFKLIINR